MNSTDLLRLLLETTLASSAAIVAVMLLRRPVRHRLGASAAYLLWLALPASLLAVLLPAPRVQAVPMLATGIVDAAAPMLAVPTASLPWSQLVAGLWLVGALAAGAGLWKQQRRFIKSLGHVAHRADGHWQAQAVVGLPAVVGVLRSRIVLPAGFEQRYSPPEQALVLLHERVHLQRGDTLINACLAVLQCLYWFNPLLPLALRHCREDQEFSCDERVLAKGKGTRRSYGNAMLKTGLALSPLPVGCHWQNHHPLKERIAMLKRPVPGKKQWVAMLVLSAGLSSGLGYAAWAAQPVQREAAVANARYYSVKLQLDVDGVARDFEVREQAGKPFAFAMDTVAGRRWEGEFKVEPQGAEKVVLSGSLHEGGRLVATPTLALMPGHAGAIQVSTQGGGSLIKMDVTVTNIGADTTAVTATSTPAASDRIVVEPADAPAGTVGFANMAPPRYPASMHTGEVLLKIDVATDGTAAKVVVERSSGHADLDEAAMEAARKWKYVPAYEQGKAVAGQVQVPVRFEMNETTVTTGDSAS